MVLPFLGRGVNDEHMIHSANTASTALQQKCNVDDIHERTQDTHCQRVALLEKIRQDFSMNTKTHCILCNNPPRSRGLCETHYAQFARAKRKLPASQKDAFDAEAVRLGKIEPVEPLANPFIEIAQEISGRLGVEAELTAKRKATPSRKKK